MRAKRTDSLDRCQDRGRHLSPLPFPQESSGVGDGNYLSLHLTLPKDLQSLDATVRLLPHAGATRHLLTTLKSQERTTLTYLARKLSGLLPLPRTPSTCRRPPQT
ncbi:hypothetical protein H6G45_19025 [Synechocystis sp. FACHB-383]|uniref:hypothetical protein n=1 Tax=Synechocystis sp. FACHB-383 TaxID=2692864 RepID=UPI0016858CF0|nr:hypothetical protein [Synechocystis sp. FACHB-383]MBD2655522.1 hypothetical protein [Synechocystis sp. FACHB-383]